MRHALSIALFCAAAATADAATLKVPSTTHPTIASALAAAGLGDVVLIKAGTYAETLDISNAIGVSVIGQGKVIIDATGNTNGIVGTNVSFSWLENLTVRNSTGHGIELTGVGASLLRKLRVENAGDDGIKLASSTAVQLVSCTTKGCGDDGFDVFADSSVVTKCVARQSQNAGIRINGFYNHVVGCTIESAVSTGLSIGFDGNSFENSFVNITVKGQNGTGVALGFLADVNSFLDIKISSCSLHGFDLNLGATANKLRNITVTSTGASGIVVGSVNNVIDTCKVTKATNEGFTFPTGGNSNLMVGCTAVSCGTGFSLAANNNTVMRSKATKCLLPATEVGNPTNIYVDNNFPDPDSF